MLQEMSRKKSRPRKKAKAAQGALARAKRAAFLDAQQKMGGETMTLRYFPSGRPVDRVILAGGATRMPCIHKLVEAETGVRVCQHVDPDEAVALGAAIYAGIIDEDVEMDVLTAWQAAVLRAEADLNSHSKQEENEEDITLV